MHLIHRLCIKLWTTFALNLLANSRMACVLLGKRALHPLAKSRFERRCHFCGPYDRDRRGPHLDHHGGHLGFAKDGEAHAPAARGRDPEELRNHVMGEAGQMSARLGAEAVVSQEVRRAAAVKIRIKAHADVDVDPRGIGLGRLNRLVQIVEAEDVGTTEANSTSGRIGQRSKAADLADGDTPPPQGARGVAQPYTLPEPGQEDGAGDPGGITPQKLDRARSADAVLRQAHVALEHTDRVLGLQPEYTVHPSRVETQSTELALERRHVIASQHPPPVVEETLPEVAARLDERVPRLAPTGAVHAETVAALEHADGGAGTGAELAVCIGVGGDTEHPQPLLQVPGCLADRSFTQGKICDEGSLPRALYRN